jgi:hypothetical protein
MSPPCSR